MYVCVSVSTNAWKNSTISLWDTWKYIHPDTHIHTLQMSGLYYVMSVSERQRAMTMQQTADPEVPAYIERRGRHWKAFILCPHCSCVHTHGAGPVSQPPDLGNRAAHCLVGPMRGYTLVPGLSEKPEGLSFRQRQRLLYEDDQRRCVPLRDVVTGW